MAEDFEAKPAAIFAALFPEYSFNECAVRYSDFVAGAYIYAKLHRKAAPPQKQKRNGGYAMNTTEMMVICREVDRATGKIAVYRIETEVTESLIFKLRLRARLNPELQYFVTTKAHYEGFGNTITAVLKRRTVSPRPLHALRDRPALTGVRAVVENPEIGGQYSVCYGHLGTLLPCTP